MQDAVKTEKQTTMERVQELDAERAKIIADAKSAALAMAQEAVAELNALGFRYDLVDGSGPIRKRRGARKGSTVEPKSLPDLKIEFDGENQK